MREPLTGDAAREALRNLLVTHCTESGNYAASLLATGRVVVLPEEEPGCVAKAARVSTGYSTAVSRDRHDNGLCSCAADALLRRWMACNEGRGGNPEIDTRAYLEGR